MKHGVVLVIGLVILSGIFGVFAYFVQSSTQDTTELTTTDEILKPIVPREVYFPEDEPPPPVEEEPKEEIRLLPPKPECPPDTSMNRETCKASCPNGVCLQVGTADKRPCLQCFMCPEGTFTDQRTCMEGNHQGCRPHSQSGPVQCWERLKGCDVPCEQNGLLAEEPDFSAEIDAQMDATSCVTSYQIHSNKSKVGNCTCYSPEPPKVVFNQTNPICKDTPCGDIPCGEKAECEDEDGIPFAIKCGWEGWQKEGKYKYRPVFRIEAKQ